MGAHRDDPPRETHAMRSGKGTTQSAKLMLILLSLIGTVTLVLVTKPYGIGLTPDSVVYISTARHIAEGLGVVPYHGTPLVLQPPLYPALLAFFDYFFEIDPLSSASVVQAVLFGLVVFFSGILFLRLLKTFVGFALLGTASVLVSIPLVRVSLMAWTELLFICILLLYLMFSEFYLEKGDIKSLVLLSLSAALACLTRYIGIILILTGTVSIIFFRGDRLRSKIEHVILFMAISAFPISLWVIRNVVLSGTLFGPRAPSIFTFSQNITYTLRTILSWYLVPKDLSAHNPTLVGINLVLMGLALLSVTVGVLVGRTSFGNWWKVRALLSEIRLPLLFIVLYIGFLVVSSTTTAYDRIDDRLLSPVFVPITLVLLFLASKIVAASSQSWLSPKGVNILLGATIGMWLLYSSAIAGRVIVETMRHGIKFSSQSWKSSQTLEYLRKNQTRFSGCVIYSNEPNALYILANLKSKAAPTRTEYNSPRIVNDLSHLRGRWPHGKNVFLVWFDRIHRKNMFSFDELQSVANITPIIRFDDGAVYSVTRK